ncbi:MAG: S41 family peptidase [Tidjanibacter sp.]|nr:S41 family peptidase [Tidjanibacter sp.]
MNRTKRAFWLPIGAAVMLALGVWAGFTISSSSQRYAPRTTSPQPQVRHNKLDLTLGLVERAYIDSLSGDSLVEELMPELMKRLDPHSIYIPKSEMQSLNEPLEGEFDGVGIVFNMATDTIVVLNIVAGGPSYKAGILPGDRIVTIDGDTVAGRNVNQNKVMSMLRGKRGSKVTVGVLRQNVGEAVPIEITRDKIPMKSIDAAFMIRPSVGYVRLTSFARTTHKEFVEAIDSLKKQGMESLVFDLRGNSGGYLDQAIAMTDEFLPAGCLMVYTEDRMGHQQKEYSTGNGRLTDLPLVVLIDEFSASSSEIVAGALQDNDRGTIIGRRSFGKGLVQSQIPFSDGSAIRLTVAKYFTPTGRSIQKPYKRGEEYEDDIWQRYASGQFFSADSIHFADSLRFVTPKGKVVYGGGGIMPDEFVPLDTLNLTPYYYAVTGLNVLYRYPLDYSDRHRAQINAIRTVEELDAMLDGDRRLYDDFIDYATSLGIKPNSKEIRQSRVLIEPMLRAYIARNTELQDSGYFSQIWPSDETLLKAFEVLGIE